MAQQVLSIIQPQGLRKSLCRLSSEEEDSNSCQNSRNQYSQKSLLTEALRASSEQSNGEPFEQEFLSQILLKSRFQDYSLAERSMIEDELERFTLRSVQCGLKGKEKEKIQTSFMQESPSEDKENREEKRRKEKRLKRQFSQCSKCEIF